MLYDYDLIEQIGSTVHLATCKKGRLAGKRVVLKELPAVTKEVYNPSDSEGIRAEMHHPSIVCLLSVFRTPFARYHVLEYCAEGSLETLMPHVDNDLLFEVTGSIASALAYLHEELVLHRNVSPGAILITHDKKTKLSGFAHAARLRTSTSYMSGVCGNVAYSSPEMTSRGSYSFPTDMWSLGCVLVACITGTPSYTALGSAKGVGPQLFDLLGGLLRISPGSRIQALGISTHSYIQHSPTASEEKPSKKSTFLQLKQSISLPPRPPSSRQPKRATSHSNVVNTDLRSLLADELASRTTQGDRPSRRVVSDPLPCRAVILADSTSKTETLPSAPPRKVPSRLQTLLTPLVPSQRQISPILRPIQTTWNTKATPSPSPPLPIGITRPLPFTTDLLAPQTHKTIHGRITILQCRSVLIDTRESRQVTHQQGWDVLIIEPDGTQIDVYNMPDMSTPWELEHPYVSYSLEDLPTAYWKQFNDAAKSVEEIKRRTPQLVLYTPVARCTLWANGPPADIELLFRSYSSSHKLLATINDAVPTMRIRFSRQIRSIEIACYVDTDQGGEWIKKDLIGYKHPADISDSDYRGLADVERDGLNQLSDFLRKCETIEAASTVPVANENIGDRNEHPSRSAMRSPLSTVVQSLSGNFIPRPVKISHQLDQPQLPFKTSYNAQPDDVSLSLASDAADSHLISLDGPNLSGFLCDTPEQSSDLQTRFIPSIGWCIRYGSRISQGGRFKIMFKDGATLDIDVDEDWAEFTDPLGDISRHGIRDCNARRRISDRFRQFEAFLSLFEN